MSDRQMKHTYCDCCSFPTLCFETVNPNLSRHPVEPALWLCTLCARSMIGNAYAYSYPEYSVVRAIAYVGNALLVQAGFDPLEFWERLRRLEDAAQSQEEGDGE